MKKEKDGKATDKKLYDIHCHAFNLSHVGIIAYINRFLRQFMGKAMDIGDLADGNLWQAAEKLFRKVRFNLKIKIILFIGGLVGFLLLEYITMAIHELLSRYIPPRISLALSFVVIFIITFLAIRLLAKIAIKRLLKKNKTLISEKTKHSLNLLNVLESTISRQLMFIEMDLLTMNSQPEVKKLEKEFKKHYKAPHQLEKIKKEWRELPPDRKGFTVNGVFYNKMVLSPLMMDFGFRDMKALRSKIPYGLPPLKPIRHQLLDLYNGICEYSKKSPFELLEFKPFLGLNPKNQRLGEKLILDSPISKTDLPEELLRPAMEKLFLPLRKLQKETRDMFVIRKLTQEELTGLIKMPKLLHQKEKIELFFKEKKLIKKNNPTPHTGAGNNPGDQPDDFPEDTLPRMLAEYFKEPEKTVSMPDPAHLYKDFDVDTDIRPGFFAGIKVYPPLGYNPWPKNAVELQKTKILYDFCVRKNIPITIHCSDGGWMVTDNSYIFSHPESWEKVLTHYKSLKLNFAHFGTENNPHKRRKNDKKWRTTILEYIKNYDNVYTDVSFGGVDTDFYGKIEKDIEEFAAANPNDNKETNELITKIWDRVLFGSDFLINLASINSYKDYLIAFGNSQLTPGTSEKISETNPKRFLG
ncbi:MAG: amidohydrolase family protein [bacterium]|nr:amidohydrolase family protein [bacterium]